jgi:hypothetical protein
VKKEELKMCLLANFGVRLGTVISWLGVCFFLGAHCKDGLDTCYEELVFLDVVCCYDIGENDLVGGG